MRTILVAVLSVGCAYELDVELDEAVDPVAACEDLLLAACELTNCRTGEPIAACIQSYVDRDGTCAQQVERDPCMQISGRKLRHCADDLRERSCDDAPALLLCTWTCVGPR